MDGENSASPTRRTWLEFCWDVQSHITLPQTRKRAWSLPQPQDPKQNRGILEESGGFPSLTVSKTGLERGACSLLITLLGPFLLWGRAGHSPGGWDTCACSLPGRAQLQHQPPLSTGTSLGPPGGPSSRVQVSGSEGPPRPPRQEGPLPTLGRPGHVATHP